MTMDGDSLILDSEQLSFSSTASYKVRIMTEQFFYSTLFIVTPATLMQKYFLACQHTVSVSLSNCSSYTRIFYNGVSNFCCFTLLKYTYMIYLLYSIYKYIYFLILYMCFKIGFCLKLLKISKYVCSKLLRRKVRYINNLNDAF